MINRGPGFLGVIPLPLSFVIKLDRRHKRRERRGEGVEVEPNDTMARKPGPLKINQYSLEKNTNFQCANAAFFTFQCGERRLKLLDILESGQ
jgi:hypothetical protein